MVQNSVTGPDQGDKIPLFLKIAEALAYNRA